MQLVLRNLGDEWAVNNRVYIGNDRIDIAAEWTRLRCERVIVDIREQGLPYQALEVRRCGSAERKMPWEIAL